MARYQLIYGDESIPYAIYRLPDRKEKIAIHVHPDGSVQVDAPSTAKDAEVHRAVGKRARWIFRRVHAIREQQYFVRPRRYVSGESHLYLGRLYQLKIDRERRQEPFVKLYRGRFYITAGPREVKDIRDQLWQWYRNRAQQVFTARLKTIAPEVISKGLKSPPMRLLEMKKQWGSCSPKGTIILNPHLVKAPRNCIDYVIYHELCHLKEHNHGKKFYQLLDQSMPGWKSTKGKLDGMANIILNV